MAIGQCVIGECAGVWLFAWGLLQVRGSVGRAEHIADALADFFVRLVNGGFGEVSVAAGSHDLGVAKELTDNAERSASLGRNARKGMTQVVKAHVLDAGRFAYSAPGGLEVDGSVGRGWA